MPTDTILPKITPLSEAVPEDNMNRFCVRAGTLLSVNFVIAGIPRKPCAIAIPKVYAVVISFSYLVSTLRKQTERQLFCGLPLSRSSTYNLI